MYYVLCPISRKEIQSYMMQDVRRKSETLEPIIHIIPYREVGLHGEFLYFTKEMKA